MAGRLKLGVKIFAVAQEIERLNKAKDLLEEELKAYQNLHSPEGSKFQMKMKQRLKVLAAIPIACHRLWLQELENQLDATMNNEVRLKASLQQKDNVILTSPRAAA